MSSKANDTKTITHCLICKKKELDGKWHGENTILDGFFIHTHGSCSNECKEILASRKTIFANKKPKEKVKKPIVFKLNPRERNDYRDVSEEYKAPVLSTNKHLR